MNINLTEEKYQMIYASLIFIESAYLNHFYQDMDEETIKEEISAINIVKDKLDKKIEKFWTIDDVITVYITLDNFKSILQEDSILLTELPIKGTNQKKLNIIDNLLKEYEMGFTSKGLNINDFIN